MNLHLLLCLLFFGDTCVAQSNRVVEGGLPPAVNKTHIFRVAATVHLPEDEYIPLALHYEKPLERRVSFYAKGGPSVSAYNNFWRGDDIQYSLNAYASAELRFYFNQVRREQKGKNATNFSANYLSVEQYIISNPLAVSGVAWKEGQAGSTGTFLNIGMQRQFGGFYLNIFWGPRISGSIFGDWYTSLGTHRGGIGLGIVL